MATRDQSASSFGAARAAVAEHWAHFTSDQQNVFRSALKAAADMHAAGNYDETKSLADETSMQVSLLMGARTAGRAGRTGRAGVSFGEVFSFLPESFTSVFGNVSGAATASSPLASWGIPVNSDMRRGYDARVIAMRFSEAAAKGDVQKGVSLLADPKVVSAIGSERNRAFTIELSGLSSRATANVEKRKAWEQWIRDRTPAHLDDARYSATSWPEMDKVIGENDDIAGSAQGIVATMSRFVPGAVIATGTTGATLIGAGATFDAAAAGAAAPPTWSTGKKIAVAGGVTGGALLVGGVAWALSRKGK